MLPRMIPSGAIEVCDVIEARGGCDFDVAPYRISDYLSAEERVRLLTAMARNAAGQSVVCQAARDAVSKYARLPAPGDAVPPLEVAQALLTYVQKDVGYIDDPEGEWYQGVRYTLSHGGDCEDMATLFVAMCACVGISARLAWLEQPSARLNHVTAQVFLPKASGLLSRGPASPQWLWAEPTISSAKIGQHPYDAARFHGTSERRKLGL